jgi:hypothetical protein
MRAVAVVIAVALLVIGGVVVHLGTTRAPRLAGTNGIDAGTFAVELPNKKVHCQTEFIPARSAALRMTIGSYDRPVPPIQVTIDDSSGRRVLQDLAPSPPDQGIVTLPLGHVIDRPLDAAQVCLRPYGTRIALGGWYGAARIEWVRPGRESYFGIAGTIVHRFGIGKAGWMGSWIAWVVIALIAAVWVVAIRLVVREVRT